MRLFLMSKDSFNFLISVSCCLIVARQESSEVFKNSFSGSDILMFEDLCLQCLLVALVLLVTSGSAAAELGANATFGVKTGRTVEVTLDPTVVVAVVAVEGPAPLHV